MTNRFDTPKAPLRAEPRPQAATQHVQSVPATPGGLIRSTLIAAGAAGAVLVLFWLPAEYGIDPTGVGALTGLTEMGEIKQQLSAEAEADAQAAAASAVAPAIPTAAVVSEEVLQRLDRIDAQLATLATAIGAPVGTAEPAPAPESAPEPAPVAEVPVALTPDSDPVEAAVAEATEAAPAASEWRDEVRYTLAPGDGIEVKLVMEEGQVARFAWSANGGVVNYDTHADGGGQSISYEQGRAVPEQEGELVAAFTGNHGWFWRNRTDAPVTLTLRTAGQYAEMRAP
ncbi:hypothetical protein [Yoonia vestfoldensis]|jgi:hypothetical protein|uniref:hypothetical protein n=1 Tax=Yoonia vestfoldensis TaxID=245188 RepID=UPI00037ED547|nr:hypothetical protein [Yoonia vestfoldensis]